MCKIEEQLVMAIRAGENFSKGNTVATWVPGEKCHKVYLHGNHIADVAGGCNAYANRQTLRRYPTATTKSRLSALGVNVTTHKGETYIDGAIV